MSENSKIEWTTHTFNPWWGCAKVSPACTHCYAESFDKRVGGKHWGDRASRRFFGEAHWSEPYKWDRKAGRVGIPARVFCASMADVFEIHPDPEIAIQQDDARRRLAELIQTTPNLRWLLLTKRPENWSKVGAQLGWCLGPDGWYEPTGRIWMGATMENQKYADQRAPELLKIPAAVHFASYEPALGPLNLRWLPPPGNWYNERLGSHGSAGQYDIAKMLDWVIAGGESGPGARPAHPDWFRKVRDQCDVAGVPFFFKQWGEWLSPTSEYGLTATTPPKTSSFCWVGRDGNIKTPGCEGLPTPMAMYRVGKKAAGRLLDGREHNEFPGETLAR